MINKAMIEIPPRFADMPPVNPRDRKNLFSPGRGDPVLRPRWKGAAGLAADVRYYGEWMRERAFEKIGHLYPKHNNETVIAWLWARTVISPNPAVNAPVPLVRFLCAEQEERARVLGEADYRGQYCALRGDEGQAAKGSKMAHGTQRSSEMHCVVSGEPMPLGIHSRRRQSRVVWARMLMAIVTEGQSRSQLLQSRSVHQEL